MTVNNYSIEEYDQLVPISHIISDKGDNNNTAFPNGWCFYTETPLLKIANLPHSYQSLPSNVDINSLSGNFVWVHPANTFSQNTSNPSSVDFDLNFYKVSNNNLQREITELQIQSFMFQQENILLKDRFKVEQDQKFTKEGDLMNIFKEAPFNYFMKLNFILLLIGVISLLSSQLSYGAVFFCSFLTVAFFTGFSLWSIHGIALFRPQFMIAGFVASIGLLVTAIGCLFV